MWVCTCECKCLWKPKTWDPLEPLNLELEVIVGFLTGTLLNSSRTARSLCHWVISPSSQNLTWGGEERDRETERRDWGERDCALTQSHAHSQTHTHTRREMHRTKLYTYISMWQEQSLSLSDNWRGELENSNSQALWATQSCPLLEHGTL